jgi:hypothetical protein
MLDVNPHPTGALKNKGIKRGYGGMRGVSLFMLRLKV